MGIRNIETLFPWDEPEPFPYPPEVYVPPDPEPEPEPEPDPTFIVNAPNASGIFTISGTNDEVFMVNASSYRLVSPFVTANGNGTFTATSAE